MADQKIIPYAAENRAMYITQQKTKCMPPFLSDT